MNKEEFMSSLAVQLRYLPQEDRDDALAYYSEYLEDAGLQPGDDLAVKIGDPKIIAQQILNECTIKQIDLRTETKSPKSSAKLVWLTLLGLCSLPVTLPIVITVVALFLAMVITAAALLVAIAVSGAACVLAGIIAVGLVFVAPGLGQKLVCLGFGLLFLGGGLLVVALTVLIAELFLKLIIWISRKVVARKNGGVA